MNPFRRNCRGVIVITAAVLCATAFFIAAGPSKPDLSLSLVGFKTNTIAGSEIGRASDLKYVSAIICMTNCGNRTITYRADLDTPGYTILQQSDKGWQQKAYVFMCGLVVSDKKLPPRQSITFRATIEDSVPCRIAVPYHTSDFKIRLQGILPAWLVQRVGWFSHQPTVMTPIIRLDENKTTTYYRYQPNSES
jgi:hypothetical protein